MTTPEPMSREPWPDEYISTSMTSSLLIMQAINQERFREQFLEEFERHAPLVVQYLREHGVIFPGE